MSVKFEGYLVDYIKTRLGTYKKYLLAALDNKECCLWYIEYSEGMRLPNADLKNCELLRDAGIFREDTRIARNGRTSYKIYCLTELGKKLSQELKEESIISDNDMLQNPITFLAQ
jgi:hypothetical protein